MRQLRMFLCGGCRFFVGESSSCRLVMGLITETDTCDRFEPADGADAADAFEKGYGS